LITHFLGEEEVSGYTKDLSIRLKELGSNEPSVWCTLGNSGDHLARKLARHIPGGFRRTRLRMVRLSYDKQNKNTSILGSSTQEATAAIVGKYVLLLDSSVHSGSSMRAAMEFIMSAGAAGVLCYSLVVKRGAAFIPHLFGVIVGDHDRALFMLDTIPNNRLFNRKLLPVGMLRQLFEADCKRIPTSLDCGVKSIDTITWGDLWYEHKVHGYQVYVIEDAGNLAAFIKLKIDPISRMLFVDIIAVDKKYQGKKLAGALMRWAETLGRATKSHTIELWSILGKISLYEGLGFDRTGETLDLGGGESYCRMQRKLLYHFDLTALAE
jgi:GNAT superfamily N-acetyltransferase/pyrimidine operon attenuation protein/uracil phosphoribosyltransferase